jgi:hypothetical protein
MIGCDVMIHTTGAIRALCIVAAALLPVVIQHSFFFHFVFLFFVLFSDAWKICKRNMPQRDLWIFTFLKGSGLNKRPTIVIVIIFYTEFFLVILFLFFFTMALSWAMIF